MIKYIILLSVLILISCQKKEETKKIENLLYFKSRFIAELGSADYDRIISKTNSKVKAKYFEDVIYVTKFIEANGCGDYIGDIKIKKDSIYLVYKLVSDEVCMSTAINKITYIIDNPTEKKYKFALKWE